MAFCVHANLDCEATWSGTRLAPAVEHRISLYGALVAALAPAGERVEVWAPAAVDPARLLATGAWSPPVMRVGTPPRIDLAWADPADRAANDRRLAHAVAALPGAKTIASPDDIDLPGAWVAKSPWTAAGRDRCRGHGPPTAEQRTRIDRLLARTGALVLEPWCDRVVDVGACATVAAEGTVVAQPAHGLIVDGRGGLLGIDLAPPALEPDEHDQLAAAIAGAGAALSSVGYAGPFGIDAFAYRDGDLRRFHPLCEINARYSFGWVARALAARLGTTRLGFGPPPIGATLLIAPAGDQITAWCA